MSLQSSKNNNYQLILGVDPGLSGALALLDLRVPSFPTLQCVWDMPTKKSGIKERRCVDSYALADLVGLYAKNIAFAVIEEVGVMGGHEGPVQMFNFGDSVGCVKGVVSSFNIPIFFIKPSVWKTLMGLNQNKDLSRSMATKKFPLQAEKFHRQKDDGRAEAALLALFGMRLLKTN